MSKSIIYVYTSPDSVDCKRLKDFLAQEEIPYQEYDITESTKRKEELSHVTGGDTVPGILIEKTSMFGNKKRLVFNGYYNNRQKIQRSLKR